MRSMRRVCVLCFVLAFALSAGFATTAASKKAKRKKVHVASQITFVAGGPEGISGRVKAKGKACRAQRRVAIFLVNSGPSVPSSDFFTTAFTGGDGSWRLPAPQAPGTFLAQVQKKKVKKKGRTVICRAASTSEPLVWPTSPG